ncbi:hypothetical protein O181_096826 [Austropuccinia psidii MF-1]|uniref:Uncharacterized protein n=1 Tax=Austropuccinia psidii MF-1 TaxID=1389203 RepID=A0A9Q3J7T6_9BASI|nr:hypothetical protein [Austropuccinia psidii MF-1]
MPSTRSGARYNPSRSSQKGHRHDYGRSHQLQKDKGQVITSKLINCVILRLIKLFYPEKERKPPQETSVEIYKASQKSYNNALQHIEYNILADLWRNCLNYYLTVRKFLGYPNNCKLLNGWHPLMAKNNMMLLKQNGGKQPSTTPASVKNSPSGQQQQLQREKAATSSEQGQRKVTSHKTLQKGLQDSKDSTGCHGKCVSDGQNNDGITKKGRSQIKISEMISDIFDSIPELYEAITDIKSHISEKNSPICNNLKTKSLRLSQSNEALIFFEKVLRTIETFNNDNSFGNKINEQSAIIKELTDKYSKFNIDDIIQTRIKQAISTIKEDDTKALDDISKSFTEVKTHIISLKKCFDTSKEEISKLTIKLTDIISDYTKQVELWNELT